MKTRNINLLPKKKISLDAKIIYFGLHYLRYIIVLTQIIVLVVFFYRFKVDQEIIDLKEQVEERKEIITVAKTMLSEALIVSEKTKYTKTIIEDQKKMDERIDRAFAYLPKQVTLTSVKFDDKKTYLQGYSLDEESIKLFYDRISQVVESDANMKNIANVKGLYTFDLEF